MKPSSSAALSESPFISTSPVVASAADYSLARYHMVASQLRPVNVSDERLLEVMAQLPRESFVPAPFFTRAYTDEPVPVAEQRFLLAPLTQALLIQAANITASDRVLDLAIGTGYSTALLASLADHVTAIESDKTLASQASLNLNEHQIINAVVKVGEPSHGFASGAPYDVIVVEGMIDALPPILADQLAENGRLVGLFDVGTDCISVGEARLYEKWHGSLSYRPLFNAQAPKLPTFATQEAFVF